jgi:hypothetical protein
MKTSTVFSTTNRLQTSKGITTSLLIAFVLLFFTIPFNLIAQNPDPGPGITIRFTNPEFFPAEETYCVDVEFLAGSEDVELFGLNARFFVDHDLFDFLGFDDFQGGYGLAADGIGVVTSTGDGDFFGFNGDALFINQAIEKVDEGATAILLSQSEWTYLFKACFILKDEAYLELDLFCPSIVWDMRDDEGRGFPAGSDGLVMTVVSDEGIGGCILASEEAMQFNWEYDDTLGANMFGVPITDPDQLDCTTTKSIPLNWWSMGVLLAGMLLFVVYRQRVKTRVSA